MDLRRSTFGFPVGLFPCSRGAGIAVGVCAALFPVVGLAHPIEWAVSAGGRLDDVSRDIAVDGAGNDGSKKFPPTGEPIRVGCVVSVGRVLLEVSQWRLDILLPSLPAMWQLSRTCRELHMVE